MIGDEVSVRVLGADGKQVKMGIDAPKDVAVHREEIYQRINQSGEASTHTPTANTPTPPGMSTRPPSARPPAPRGRNERSPNGNYFRRSRHQGNRTDFEAQGNFTPMTSFGDHSQHHNPNQGQNRHQRPPERRHQDYPSGSGRWDNTSSSRGPGLGQALAAYEAQTAPKTQPKIIVKKKKTFVVDSASGDA